jgi:hypothetical protein
MIFFLFLAGAGAARYQQSFDTAMVANGSQNTLLSDGAYVNGSALVNDGELVLTSAFVGLTGALLVPALNGSSLGWTMSFKLRFGALAAAANTTPTEDALRLHWGPASVNSSETSLRSSAVGTWVLKSAGPLMRGFVRGSVLVRTPESILALASINRTETVSATLFVSWNPELGASFRSTGFLIDVDLRDVEIPPASLAHKFACGGSHR